MASRTRGWSGSQTGANLIVFSSGWDDACYASYFGYDAKGKAAERITDFSLLANPAHSANPALPGSQNVLVPEKK